MSEDINNQVSEDTKAQVNTASTVNMQKNAPDGAMPVHDEKYEEIRKLRAELKTRRLESEEMKEILTSLRNEIESVKAVPRNNDVHVIKDALINAELRNLLNSYNPHDADVVKKMIDFSKVEIGVNGVNGLQDQLDNLLATKSFLFQPKQSSNFENYSINKDGVKVDPMKLSAKEAKRFWKNLDKMN